MSEALLRCGATDLSETDLANVVEQHIQSVLEGCGGNRTLAAQLLGIPRRSLQRKLISKRPGKRDRRRKRYRKK